MESEAHAPADRHAAAVVILCCEEIIRLAYRRVARARRKRLERHATTLALLPLAPAPPRHGSALPPFVEIACDAALAILEKGDMVSERERVLAVSLCFGLWDGCHATHRATPARCRAIGRVVAESPLEPRVGSLVLLLRASAAEPPAYVALLEVAKYVLSAPDPEGDLGAAVLQGLRIAPQHEVPLRWFLGYADRERVRGARGDRVHRVAWFLSGLIDRHGREPSALREYRRSHAAWLHAPGETAFPELPSAVVSA